MNLNANARLGAAAAAEEQAAESLAKIGCVSFSWVPYASLFGRSARPRNVGHKRSKMLQSNFSAKPISGCVELRCHATVEGHYHSVTESK